MVGFVPRHALIDAAPRKRVKYEAKYADIMYGFLRFTLSSFGELEKDATALLKRILKFFVTQYIGAHAAIHIFSRIRFDIAKGVGAQIVSRLLTIFIFLIAVVSAAIGGSMEYFIIKSGFYDKVTVLESEKKAWENSPEAQAMREALNPWRKADDATKHS
nr:uncharacterized protein [Tanacetum cinerariifolium]